MIKIENIKVSGWEAALRGMRNPKDSWHLSDSTYEPEFRFGPNDLKLAKMLHKGGPVHSKYKRYIIITMDITAPLYWWNEFDTYKVGTVANSCSTMHKIEAYEFTRDMFSYEHLNTTGLGLLDMTIQFLNKERARFNESDKKDKDAWWQLIQSLPSSFNQKRTVQLSYENATSMYMWRHNHKQDEWRELCKVFETLPYADDILIPPTKQQLDADKLCDEIKKLKINVPDTLLEGTEISLDDLDKLCENISNLLK